MGKEIYEQTTPNPIDVNLLNTEQQYNFFKGLYAMGRNYIANHPSEYGDITARPTDRRENYVKRCVGLPGQTLQIKNRTDNILMVNLLRNQRMFNILIM